MALSCCKNVDIPRVDLIDITKDEFIENHLKTGTPVIIERATDKWPAKQWTIDSLCELVGDNIVSVRSNTNCTEYKLGKKYNIRETPFKSYIADLKANNKRAQNSYLAVQNIRKSLPQLQDQIQVPEYVGKLHGGPFLWIAHGGHYALHMFNQHDVKEVFTPKYLVAGHIKVTGMSFSWIAENKDFRKYCHFDPDDGFLIIIQGSKQVRLFGCGIDTMYPNPLGSKGRTVQSTVDCEEPDMDRHPLFEGITCHHCQLMAEKYFIFQTDCRWPAFKHWLLNIIEQNRGYPSWPRTLSRLPEALNNFIINQWHDYATESQLELLVSEIKQYLKIEELPDEKSSGKHPPPLQIRGLVWRC
ncbi:hypothetical protein LSH36_93g03003 [Paralvinella palmiformis]|uniref:Cupin-like domain-containing protein n=1 Tax=Paralvinella palmiformis TaxID=53620 RepID=A0AAD9NBP7_9ANNE|nr:hypothetical protein LSH36_93g03003 [Paralvinella palmiformis]